MSEMADLDAENYWMEKYLNNHIDVCSMYPAIINKSRGNRKMTQQKPFRYTEEILNANTWEDANGKRTIVTELDGDHLRNILQYLYKNKDRYWLKCRNAALIESFENGEDFFQRCIRVSTLWTAIIYVLTHAENEGFNFEFIPKG
jgi:hypothetical protein